MKSSFSVALGLLVGVLPWFAGAVERDVEKELAAFAYEGVSLSMPQAEFVRRVDASAFFRTADQETGVATYRAFSPKNADAVSYDLLDGKVQKITITYQPDRLKDMGGAVVVSDKLTERFGIPTYSHGDGDRGAFSWEAPRASRRLLFMWNNTNTSITVEDTAGGKIIDERKVKQYELKVKRLDLGF